jgi:hypothetical protein
VPPLDSGRFYKPLTLRLAQLQVAGAAAALLDPLKEAQAEIHQEQKNIGEIRDRLSDEARATKYVDRRRSPGTTLVTNPTPPIPSMILPASAAQINGT